jgi:transcriptional regulator with XRE-family HTH domain
MGEQLRALRRQNGWSLAEVSKRTGVSVSALSKAENGKMSLTYEKLAALSGGLGVDIGYFFSGPPAPTEPNGGTRRSVDRHGTGRLVNTPNYVHFYLNAELLQKKLVPIEIEVLARTLEEFGALGRHEGEECLYVLEGEIVLCTEHYEPVRLAKGDSIYIDSGMGHAYLKGCDGPCRALVVSSAPRPDRTAH